MLRKLTIVVLVSGGLLAAAQARWSAAGEPRPADAVDMFAAMDQGLIETRFIAANQHKARLQITNKTDQPIRIQVPEVFAGVPVLAQFGQGIFNTAASGTSGQSNQGPFLNLSDALSQPVSAGQNQSQSGFPIWNVPPEKPVELKLACLCLAYGKRTPRAAIPYRAVPLEAVNSSPELRAVVKASLSGDVDTKVAQAAAWHLANEMPWDEIAQIKGGQLHVYKGRLPYISHEQIETAKELVEAARQEARGKQQPRVEGQVATSRP